MAKTASMYTNAKSIIGPELLSSETLNISEILTEPSLPSSNIEDYTEEELGAAAVLGGLDEILNLVYNTESN